jgi:hypothetical protein
MGTVWKLEKFGKKVSMLFIKIILLMMKPTSENYIEMSVSLILI